MQAENFWSANERAAKISKESAAIQNEIDVWQKMDEEARDILSLAKELQAEGDHSLQADLAEKLRQQGIVLLLNYHLPDRKANRVHQIG